MGTQVKAREAQRISFEHQNSDHCILGPTSFLLSTSSSIVSHILPPTKDTGYLVG